MKPLDRAELRHVKPHKLSKHMACITTVHNHQKQYLLFLLGKRGPQSLEEAEEHCTVDAIGQSTCAHSPAHACSLFRAEYMRNVRNIKCET